MLSFATAESRPRELVLMEVLRYQPTAPMISRAAILVLWLQADRPGLTDGRLLGIFRRYEGPLCPTIRPSSSCDMCNYHALIRLPINGISKLLLRKSRGDGKKKCDPGRLAIRAVPLYRKLISYHNFTFSVFSPPRSSTRLLSDLEPSGESYRRLIFAQTYQVSVGLIIFGVP